MLQDTRDTALAKSTSAQRRALSNSWREFFVRLGDGSLHASADAVAKPTPPEKTRRASLTLAETVSR